MTFRCPIFTDFYPGSYYETLHASFWVVAKNSNVAPGSGADTRRHARANTCAISRKILQEGDGRGTWGKGVGGWINRRYPAAGTKWQCNCDGRAIKLFLSARPPK